MVLKGVLNGFSILLSLREYEGYHRFCMVFTFWTYGSMGTCKFLHLLQESPRRWAKQWCYAFILACVDVTNHVTFQSWFHDNLCSSSKGMEKPVFERNYVYIYIFNITLSKYIKIRFHRWLGLPKGKHGQIISALGPYRTDPKNQAIRL